MKRAAGFTLIEIVVAMVILGALMLMLWSGLSFSMRSWDAGDRVGRAAADRRIGEAFLRRELGELFPMRWKDPTRVVVAFEGTHEHLRFVSSRPAGISIGGLALVSLDVAGDARRGERHLIMRRALPDDEAKSFAPLDAAEPTILISGVDSMSLEYFGSENDFSEPKWRDDWQPPERIPQLVRMHVKLADGSLLPEITMRVMMSEEAGCLDNSFQRFCRPRRAAT
jgi:general secretion pathway protein J